MNSQPDADGSEMHSVCVANPGNSALLAAIHALNLHNSDANLRRADLFRGSLMRAGGGVLRRLSRWWLFSPAAGGKRVDNSLASAVFGFATRVCSG
jgi:hypothetical protein